MRIAIAADHAGFKLKEALSDRLRRHGHVVEDLGTRTEESTDYPDYAASVAERISSGEADRGVLVCSTGIGMSIAANKFPGIRAALAINEEGVQLTRSHNDANVLALGAKFLDESDAERLVQIFLDTKFDGETRHARRLDKIARIERSIHQERTATKV